MTGTVVVNKEFIALYNQVVDKLGLKATLDEDFYPSNIEMVEKVANLNIEVAVALGFTPSMFGFSKDEWLKIRIHVLDILKLRREEGKPLGYGWLWKDEFVQEWNNRLANKKPLPCRFDDSLLQYVESITLDIETFQSMQKAITESLDD